MTKQVTTKTIRSTMAHAYRLSAGQTVTVELDGVTITAPAFIDGVNTGQTILDALAFHRESWGQSLTGATKELAGRYRDMMADPNRPTADLVAIDWVLDLNYLVTGDFLE